MLEEFMNVMTDNDLNTVEEELKNAEVKNLIDGLELFSNDPQMLTNAYTDILCSDNVVYLLTRISQHPIFKKHFPEFYEKNENDESVINCQQNSRYHRYGVFRHILYTIEYVGKDNLNFSREELKLLKWTMFLHDIGKPRAKTTNLEGKDSFAGHEEISVEIATEILNRLYFTDAQKKIILTLILYHDKYLNEGELTQDNLAFLAQELENKKELFDMIIEVKTADNKAKSIEVYNRFLMIIPKYLEFENYYFAGVQKEVVYDFEASLEADYNNINNDDELIVGIEEKQNDIIKEDEDIIIDDNVEKMPKSKKVSDKITKEGFDQIYQNILNRMGLEYFYIPIIDIRNKVLFGYEIKAKLDNELSFDEFLKMAKEEGKFEKIHQLLALNLMENGVKIKPNKKQVLIVRMDLRSFLKYNNKARIYDITDKDNVLILFENYDYSNITDINEMCREIRKKHGFIGFADFQNSTFTLKEMSNMDIDVIEYNYDKNDEKIEELVEFCSSNTQKLWVSNVKSKKLNASLYQKKVEYVSGNGVFSESEQMGITDYEAEKLVDNL